MPKFATVAFDSGSELARLFFSKKIGKTGADMDKIRGVQDYADVTERLNILIRRMKNLRNKGVNVVFLAHEDLQKVFARGGMIAQRGQAPTEPIAVKGWPDFPGSRTPDEMCRAADNVFHVRYVNGKVTWVARREAIGGGGGTDYWEVKDRFNAPAIAGGMLPSSYEEVRKLAMANPNCDWNDPYIWILYGAFGIGKTRSLLTFPRPIRIFDLDLGSDSINKETKASNGEIDVIKSINVEDGGDYNEFLRLVEECF